MGHKKTKLNICHHMLTSSTQLQNWSFHVVERTTTSTKCQKMKNARAKRAKILFFIVKYANLWGFYCRRRRGCLSSLLENFDSRKRTTTSTRFSYRATLSARKPTSFWREKRDTVVTLVRGFAKMLSRQNKSRTRW